MAQAPSLGAAGSDLERRRPRSRSLKRRLLRALKAPFVAVLAYLAPRVLLAYCWLVWKTSRVESTLFLAVTSARARHGRLMTVLWHQEVLTVAYAFRPLRPHTLASAKDVGAMITRVLEYAGFVVFRSSASGRGKSGFAIRAMIEHMEDTPGVLYGLTVDGSRGPRFRLKPGAVKIARACRAPTYLCGTSFSRRIELPTWDRMVVPLPFSRIRIDAVGPYWVAPDASREDEKEFRDHLERELLELHVWQRRCLDGREPSGKHAGLPSGFTPIWPATLAGRGVPRTAHDLRPDDPPPWAPRPAEEFAEEPAALERAASERAALERAAAESSTEPTSREWTR